MEQKGHFSAKRLLIILAISFAATGVLYLYTTDSHLTDFLRDTPTPDARTAEVPDSLSSQSIPGDDSKKRAIEEKKKVPKTVKPGPFYAIDEYARKTPKQYATDPQTLAQYLIQPAKTDLQKVRAIFGWIAMHIQYDHGAYNDDNYPEQSAVNVLATGKAVCEGYTALMHTLCEAAELEAEPIFGYAKGYDYQPGDRFTKINHAWNTVKINDAWHLFDVTWACTGTTNFEPFWFDVHPKAFIFTHLPAEPSWQLTGDIWELEEYERQPFLSEDFFTVGVDPNEIYREVRSGTTKEFVEMYDSGFPMKIVRMPYSKNQPVGQELSFKIQSDYAEDIVLVDGNDWHHFKKQDNTFTLLHKPASSELQISVKINWFDDEYLTIAAYSKN